MLRFTKSIKLLVISIAVVFTLSGCGDFQFANDDLLVPPRANGEMYDIQQALDKSVGSKYTLKYPTTGKYRSAYILADLMDTGEENFVIAFYSVVNAENTATMNMTLLKKVDSEWLTLSNVTMAAIGIEKVELADLNGDGISEIIVGWNIYGGVDKKLMVYELEGITLTPLIQEAYTTFICCDLKEDGWNEVFLLKHDTTTSVATVGLYSFGDEGVIATGNCVIDGKVTSFSDPVFSKLSGGKPAVFIDALKGTGMQTEIVYFENGSLVAPLYDEERVGFSPTYRDTAVAAIDINNDGCLDIPFSVSLEGFSELTDISALNPVTKWCSFNGGSFIPSVYAMMNYSDGYYIEMPEEWLSNVTITRATESRLRIFNLWDMESGVIEGELFRIKTVAESEWDKANNGFAEYFEIARTDGVVYAAKISSSAGNKALSKEETKKLFNLIA